MKQNEFQQRVNLINNLSNEANMFRDKTNISANIEKLTNCANTLENLYKNIDERNQSFLQYLNLLEEFSYSDNLTSPSDLFPAVRVPAKDVDFETLKKKDEEMQNLATTVDMKNKQAEVESRTAIKAMQDAILGIKQSLEIVSEYILQQSSVQDTAIDLLRDMDSVYDISALAKNS